MGSYAMNPLYSTARSRRHLVWMLWFALCVPVAQFAAERHVLSHVSLDAGVSQDVRHTIHGDLPCEICALAAAVTAGAPRVEPQSVQLADASHAIPQFAPPSNCQRRCETAYQSRAPPVASR